MSKLYRNALLRWAPLWQVLALSISVQLIGCGGGGGSQGQPPPPPPPPGDFGLTVSPTSQSVDAGNSSSISVSATASNGFSSQVSVQVSGVPAGVTVSPTNITLMPGTPQQVTLTAAANASNSKATLTFTGTSGSLTHTAQLEISVFSSFGAPGRTGYQRSDATTLYFGWLNQHWIVFDPGTSRFFVTDPFSNRVNAFDSATETQVGTIAVPGAFGIDETPDHSTLYVGTLIGDVYAVDPVSMSVKRRYIASEIGPYGYLAFSALVLADGRLALLGAQGGIPSVDGSTSLALWNPADNSMTLYGGTGQVQGLPLPCGGFMGNIGGFTITADRTSVLVGSIDSDGTLCEINASTGKGNYSTVASFSLNHILTSPDGKYIILPRYPTDTVLYDVQTLNKVGEFSVLGDTSSGSGFAISADSKTLFTPTDSIVYAYDVATGQMVGWVPNVFLFPYFVGAVYTVSPALSPYLLASDGKGLFAGPMGEGIGFVDLSALQTAPVGTQFTNAYIHPPAGPVSGDTQAQWGSQMLASTQGSVYFGSQRSPQVSNSGGNITATTPPGQPGPVTVYAFSTDGGMEIVPEGFSYGPTVLETTPNRATPEGGGTGFIYGFGFGPANSGVIPPDLQITVGGKTAQVLGFNPNAYNVLIPPFQLQSVAYTIPPGAVGPADVTVSDNSGTTTISGAMTYLPPLRQFPLPGASLAQGVYDPYTDLYYFTDSNKIQVFSRTQGQWFSPITIPPPQGTSQRLWGIALSPDGSKLAVSDSTAGVIYVLNPANPTSVKTFTVGSQGGFLINPCGVAVSDAGNVYYEVYVQGGTGADQFFKLNTNTGAITDYGVNSPGLGLSDLYLRAAISSDNARVFFNDLGYVFSVDTATDKLFSATVDQGCCYGDYDLSLSSNQTQFTATSYLYDADLNGVSYYALTDREALNISYVYGAKLSPDGRLVFQPSTNGIDVFDGRLGDLRTRISLPMPLSINYDALVADGRDNVLVAITGTNGNGVAIVDLTSLPEPPPRAYEPFSASQPHRLTELGDRWRALKGTPHSVEQKRQPTLQSRRVPHVTMSIVPHVKSGGARDDAQPPRNRVGQKVIESH